MVIALYLAAVVAVNMGFSYVPMFETPIGLVSPMAAVVGVIFVLRDYGQRYHGHLILPAMIAGLTLSWLLADPMVATASAVSFGLSEFADWLVYTITKKPFGQRVLVSSVVAAPVDTLVFLWMVEADSIGTFCLMVLSKVIASIVVYLLNRRSGRVIYAGAEQSK